MLISQHLLATFTGLYFSQFRRDQIVSGEVDGIVAVRSDAIQRGRITRILSCDCGRVKQAKVDTGFIAAVSVRHSGAIDANGK